ncbi:MAG: hypothetical protein ABIB04_03955 [Patescibacteria group bacterium]
MPPNFEAPINPQKSKQELQRITPEEFDAAFENLEVGEIAQLKPTRDIKKLAQEEEAESQSRVDEIRSHIIGIGEAGLHREYPKGTRVEFTPKASKDLQAYARELEQKMVVKKRLGERLQESLKKLRGRDSNISPPS